jgi:hypothetical protein
VRQFKSAHRPVRGRDGNAHAALLAHALAQLQERQVVLFLNELIDEQERVGVEQGCLPPVWRVVAGSPVERCRRRIFWMKARLTRNCRANWRCEPAPSS